MPRTDEAVTSILSADKERTDTHPAFGVAVVTRTTGSPRTMFQSDLRHNDSIRLSIQTAERHRHLLRDWVFPRKTIVEVEMSLAQWGALVSSIGIGSGVPVTIRQTSDNHMVPGIPYEPRIGESVDEAKSAVSRLLEHARESLSALEEAVQSGRIGEIKKALRAHGLSIHHAESNAGFAVTSLSEAAESLTSQARVDIEAQILAASQITGLTASIEAPTGMGEIEGRD